MAAGQLEVGIARHPDRVAGEDLVPVIQARQVPADHVLEPHEDTLARHNVEALDILTQQLDRRFWQRLNRFRRSDLTGFQRSHPRLKIRQLFLINGQKLRPMIIGRLGIDSARDWNAALAGLH